jgi:hypothetical protein
MPGILEQQMNTTPTGLMAPKETATSPAPTAAPTGVNEKELDIFVANGMKMIHDPKISDTIITQVADAKDPIKAVADTTLNVVGKLEQSSAAAGKKLSLTTLAYGGNVLMGEIIASAEAAGMQKMDEKTRYYAFSLALGKYLEDAVKTGKMTEAEVIQLGKDAEATDIGKKMGTARPPVEAPIGGQNGTA